MKKTTKKVKPYSVTLAIGKDIYNSGGISLLEALKTMKPKFFNGIGKITVEHEGKISSVPIRLTKTKLERIFNRPVDLELFARRLQTIM